MAEGRSRVGRRGGRWRRKWMGILRKKGKEAELEELKQQKKLKGRKAGAELCCCGMWLWKWVSKTSVSAMQCKLTAAA